MIKAAGTLALCGVLLLGGSAPALAAPHPKARLKVVSAVKGGPAKAAWLNCAPVGGTHPNAKAACRLLTQVKGDPAKLNVSPKATCSQEVQPYAAVIAGRWYGQKVRWSKAFVNGCAMQAMTGPLLAL